MHHLGCQVQTDIVGSIPGKKLKQWEPRAVTVQRWHFSCGYAKVVFEGIQKWIANVVLPCFTLSENRRKNGCNIGSMSGCAKHRGRGTCWIRFLGAVCPARWQLQLVTFPPESCCVFFVAHLGVEGCRPQFTLWSGSVEVVHVSGGKRLANVWLSRK